MGTCFFSNSIYVFNIFSQHFFQNKLMILFLCKNVSSACYAGGAEATKSWNLFGFGSDENIIHPSQTTQNNPARERERERERESP